LQYRVATFVFFPGSECPFYEAFRACIPGIRRSGNAAFTAFVFVLGMLYFVRNVVLHPATFDIREIQARRARPLTSVILIMFVYFRSEISKTASGPRRRVAHHPPEGADISFWYSDENP